MSLGPKLKLTLQCNHIVRLQTDVWACLHEPSPQQVCWVDYHVSLTFAEMETLQRQYVWFFSPFSGELAECLTDANMQNVPKISDNLHIFIIGLLETEQPTLNQDQLLVKTMHILSAPWIWRKVTWRTIHSTVVCLTKIWFQTTRTSFCWLLDFDRSIFHLLRNTLIYTYLLLIYV